MTQEKLPHRKELCLQSVGKYLYFPSFFNTNSNSNSEQQLKTIIQNINSKISFSFNHLMTQLCVGYFKIFISIICIIALFF